VGGHSARRLDNHRDNGCARADERVFVLSVALLDPAFAGGMVNDSQMEVRMRSSLLTLTVLSPAAGFSMAGSLPTPPLPSDADATVNRAGSSSRKFDGPNRAWVCRSPKVVPLWIADMDFRSPQPIVDALVARAQTGVYGYTDPSPALEALTLNRLQSVYGCTVEPSVSWLRWLPGLIPGLNHGIRACCRAPTDAVAIPTPVYAPFLTAATNCQRPLISVPLAEEQLGSELHFEVDWAALEAACAAPTTKLLHWCNPHNPVGRCWTRAELVRVARLCVCHDVVLSSDEVWGELPLDVEAHPFHSMLSLIAAEPSAELASISTTATVPPESDPEAVCGVPGLRERLIMLTSPSKCFNVASLDLAVAVIPDANLARRFRNCGRDAAEVTCFGYSAALSAYGDAACEVWRQRLVEYLRANRELAFAVLSSVEGMRCVRPEASYLMWIDATDALPKGTNAEAFFLEAGVGLTGGVPFGGSMGIVRLNFGCRRETLEEGLERMVSAVEAARD